MPSAAPARSASQTKSHMTVDLNRNILIYAHTVRNLMFFKISEECGQHTHNPTAETMTINVQKERVQQQQGCVTALYGVLLQGQRAETLLQLQHLQALRRRYEPSHRNSRRKLRGKKLFYY